MLSVPPLGTVNLHFSLLPRWRGAAPVQRAILEGDELTGVSVMLLDEGLDTGPVLVVREEPILPDDDTGSLGARLAEIGAPLVIDALRALDGGTASPAPQSPGDATTAAKLLPEERSIDWRQPADAIVRRVRAFAPSPGATTTFRETALKLVRVEIRELGLAPGARPGVGPGVGPRVGPRVGEVWLDRDGTPTVVTSDGGIALLEVGPAGRGRMSGADWARGARIRPEERFV